MAWRLTIILRFRTLFSETVNNKIIGIPSNESNPFKYTFKLSLKLDCLKLIIKQRLNYARMNRNIFFLRKYIHNGFVSIFSVGLKRRVSPAWKNRITDSSRTKRAIWTRRRGESRSPNWKTIDLTRIRYPVACDTTWLVTGKYDADIRTQGHRLSSPWKCYKK